MEKPQEIETINQEYIAWKNKVTYVLIALVGVGILLTACLFKLF